MLSNERLEELKIWVNSHRGKWVSIKNKTVWLDDFVDDLLALIDQAKQPTSDEVQRAIEWLSQNSTDMVFSQGVWVDNQVNLVSDDVRKLAITALRQKQQLVSKESVNQKAKALMLYLAINMDSFEYKPVPDMITSLCDSIRQMTAEPCEFCEVWNKRNAQVREIYKLYALTWALPTYKHCPDCGQPFREVDS